MKRSARFWPALLSAGLLLLIAAPPTSAQTKPYQAFLEGTEVFRRILFDRQFAPLYTFNDLNRDPQHTILIVFGDAGALLQIPGGLDGFLANGGALFLATDRALPGEAGDALNQVVDVQVSGQSLICHDKDSCYKGFDYCPYLIPTDGAKPNLFRNVTMKVASNAPSYLYRRALFPRGEGLASLPRNCVLEGTDVTFATGQLFAVGADVKNGRVLVLADHSIFINEMMLPEDNSNVEFTYNCLEWLRGNAKDGRSQVLFVEDGRVNSRFDVPLKEMPNELMKRLIEYMGQHPDEAAKLALSIVSQYPKETAKLALDVEEAADKTAQEITPKIEQSVREFDERDGFNAGFSGGALQGLAIWLAVLVVLYGCYRIGWKSRHRSDLQGPLLALTLHRLAPADTVATQRRRDLIRDDNLWEPARDMARQSLAASGSPAASAPPRIVVQGGWLRRWSMTARVRRLWRLAYGSPTRVSLNQWRRLLREVQQLKTALASGAVRFQG
jgi:hypothetical protein